MYPSTFEKSSSFEEFPAADLSGLREDIMQSGLDSWQAADIISVYLSGRGYGVSPASARNAAFRLGVEGCSVRLMREEFEKLALVT